MRPLPAALLLAASLAPGLAPCQASAETMYQLDKVSVTGNVQVPSATLNAALHETPGTKVTRDDILADQDNILAVYKKANVGMAVKVLLASQSNGHYNVTFSIDEKAAPPPQTVTLQNKLAHVNFTGNTVESTDSLLAASGLKIGDVVTNDSLKAAQQAIMSVYQKDHNAKLANVNITGNIATPTPGLVDLTWQVTETKGKKKPRNTDDPGAESVQ